MPRYDFTAGVGLETGPVPRLLVALTTHVYVLPAVRLETVTWSVPPVEVTVLVWFRDVPPLDELQAAVKLVIRAPLFAGTVNVTRNVPDEAGVAFAFCG